MSLVRFCIVGCGVIAHWHAKAIQASENGVLAGVVDVRYESACEFAKQYGVSVYKTIAEMTADPEIDAVCICTPSGFHAATALEAIAAGKHVIVEKPMAMTVEECDRIIRLAEEKQVCAGVICQYRFSPAIQTLKALVDAGKLGKIITVNLSMQYQRTPEYYKSSSWRGTWALDGGSVMNQGIHGVDAMLYILGNVISVQGYARTLYHDIEAEDTSVAALEFENGAIGVLQSTTAIKPGYPRRMMVSGTAGCVVVEDDRVVLCDVEGYAAPLEQEPTVKNEGFQVPGNISNEGHDYQIQDFISAILDKRQPAVTLQDGRRAVALINGIYEASRNNSIVRL